LIQFATTAPKPAINRVASSSKTSSMAMHRVWTICATFA
jgi:hypothetical protein